MDWQRRAENIERRLAVVEDENDRLREEIAVLRKLVGQEETIPRVLGLTQREAGIFVMLLARPMVSKSDAMTMYSLHADGDVPMEKIIDVFVCKMRAKLKVFGISINTIWGRGWNMAQADKNIVARLLEAENGAPILVEYAAPAHDPQRANHHEHGDKQC
ncbi:MAG: helix-turn-helix domain-containing protein [Janthinobacterium lividum]